MTDDLEWATAIDDPTRYEKPHRLCRHPRWRRGGTPEAPVCLACNRELDPVRLARGRSSRRLGGDQERRIERLYGPRKVGEFGDAIDHLGSSYKWQSKASRGLPPGWLAIIHEPVWRLDIPKFVKDAMGHMHGLGGTRAPLVIRSFVRQGVSTRDWIFLDDMDWIHAVALGELGAFTHGYVVMSGEAFLAIHGSDEQVESGEALAQIEKVLRG